MNHQDARRAKVAGDVAAYIAAGGSIEAVPILIRPYQKPKLPTPRPEKSKLNPQAVRSIRNSIEKPAVLAKKLGITQDYVRKIRAHARRKEFK